MATNLNKLFVFVSNNNVDTFVSTHLGQTSDSYAKKIAFLGGTGEIMTHGEKFAINSAADVAALKELVGSGSLNSSLSADTIIGAINEIYTLAYNNQQSIGTINTSVNGLETSVSTINTSVNSLETNAATLNSSVSSLESTVNLLTSNAETEGSIDQKIAQAKKEILTGDSTETISTAYDTILEIAQWIENDQTGAAAMAAQIIALDSSVDALQAQVDTLSGDITTEITTAIEALDSSVSLAGTTASDPVTVTKDSSIEVLGGLKIVENNGLLDQTNSTKIILKADAAGAAAAVYDVLLGTAQDDSTNNTILGLKNEIAGKNVTATGETGDSSLVYATAANNQVTVASTQKLQDAVALAETALQGLTVTTTNSDALTVTGSPVSKNSAQLTFTPNTGNITVDGSTNTLKYTAGDGNKLVTVDNIVTAINDIDMWEELNS